MSGFAVGALMKVEKDEGGYYTAMQQVDEVNTLPKPVQGSPQSRHEIDTSFGPVKTMGYVVSDTFEIGIETLVLGIKLGSFYGNLKDGLEVKLDLTFAKGSLKYYLKNERDVWEKISIQIQFGQSFDNDRKLMRI